MLKTIMIAGALGLSMVVASPVGPASAGTSINVGMGLGDRGYDPGPNYWPARSGISCGEGRRIVAYAGYRSVRPLDCNGSEYTYAGRRGDRWFKITVRSKNGNIRKVERLRRGGGGWGGGGWGGGGGYGGDDYDDGGYDDGGYDDGDY